MTNERSSVRNAGFVPRRTVLKTAAGIAGGGALSGVTSAQSATYRLEGEVSGWRGREPAAIGGETNPTLTLRPGTEYTVVWENLDGAPHNFTIKNADGNDVAGTETMSSQGETRSLTFTASEEMAQYLCTIHPSTMTGDVRVDGGTTRTARQSAYDWQAATWDSYWYSLYNMSTTISVSGNGILFPHNEEQKKAFQKRRPAMLKAANREKPPIKNANLDVAPFTKGDPHFTRKPVFDAGDGRPDASTLEWDLSKSSKVVSPSSLAWTHLKGVTWAKNFQNHFDLLPDSLAPRFRSEVLSALAQLGIKFSLVDGNLRANDENMLLVAGWSPKKGVVGGGPRPLDHSAMLWFMSDMVSLSEGGWFGYENPKPLIPPEKIQTMADGVGRTVMKAFPPDGIVERGSTRDLGEFLGAIGWYGTHAGNDRLRSMAADYANALAKAVADATDGNGRVGDDGANQAATQGVIGQGLVWASQIDGVDHTDQAKTVLGYLVDSLWDADAGTFASREEASTYTIRARDAGDITGGLNAADAELGMDVRDIYARYFDEAFNHGRLQRAERPPSHDPESEYPLPLPPKAGGQYGQAAVYNTEVQYGTGSGEWSVTDALFDTEQALYLANQDVWIGQWGGDFFQGRGVPGKSDSPE